LFLVIGAAARSEVMGEELDVNGRGLLLRRTLSGGRSV
jgi:hypothetical protein